MPTSAYVLSTMIPGESDPTSNEMYPFWVHLYQKTLVYAMQWLQREVDLWSTIALHIQWHSRGVPPFAARGVPPIMTFAFILHVGDKCHKVLLMTFASYDLMTSGGRYPL